MILGFFKGRVFFENDIKDFGFLKSNRCFDILWLVFI